MCDWKRLFQLHVYAGNKESCKKILIMFQAVAEKTSKIILSMPLNTGSHIDEWSRQSFDIVMNLHAVRSNSTTTAINSVYFETRVLIESFGANRSRIGHIKNRTQIWFHCSDCEWPLTSAGMQFSWLTRRQQALACKQTWRKGLRHPAN